MAYRHDRGPERRGSVACGSQLFRVAATNSPRSFSKTHRRNFYWIRNLFTCTDGSLLVATVNGLFRINDDQVEHWTTAEGLADQDVICVNEDDDGTIWVGQIAGLTRMQKPQSLNRSRPAQIDPSIKPSFLTIRETFGCPPAPA